MNGSSGRGENVIDIFIDRDDDARSLPSSTVTYCKKKKEREREKNYKIFNILYTFTYAKYISVVVSHVSPRKPISI